MVKYTILDLIKSPQMSGGVSDLGETTPELKDHLRSCFIKHNDSNFFYIVTVTLDRSVKNESKRLVYKLAPRDQIRFFDLNVLPLFSGMLYIGVYEFTKSAVCHLHLLCSVTHCKIYNSTVEAGIKYSIAKFGKANTNKRAVSEVRNPEGSIDYILKEIPPVDNLRYSTDFYIG